MMLFISTTTCIRVFITFTTFSQKSNFLSCFSGFFSSLFYFRNNMIFYRIIVWMFWVIYLYTFFIFYLMTVSSSNYTTSPFCLMYIIVFPSFFIKIFLRFPKFRRVIIIFIFFIKSISFFCFNILFRISRFFTRWIG